MGRALQEAPFAGMHRHGIILRSEYAGPPVPPPTLAHGYGQDAVPERGAHFVGIDLRAEGDRARESARPPTGTSFSAPPPQAKAIIYRETQSAITSGGARTPEGGTRAAAAPGARHRAAHGLDEQQQSAVVSVDRISECGGGAALRRTTRTGIRHASAARPRITHTPAGRRTDKWHYVISRWAESGRGPEALRACSCGT